MTRKTNKWQGVYAPAQGYAHMTPDGWRLGASDYPVILPKPAQPTKDDIKRSLGCIAFWVVLVVVLIGLWLLAGNTVGAAIAGA